MNRMSDEPHFASVAELIARLDPSYPIFCVYPGILKARARAFMSGFPGRTLYAVKCNPDPRVLRALHEAGVRHFDTASLGEISRVTELFPDAQCYFNHPVKGRGALEAAAEIYGLKDYVVDHISELDKLTGIVGTEIIVEVRISTPKGKAVYDLSSKFGASPDNAVALLREADRRGARTAISFHVGSQCLDPEAYRIAMGEAADVARRAGVPIAYLDVGGGFPAEYGTPVPPLSAYLETIVRARDEFGLDMPLYAEPGRALAADGCSVLAQVQLRKDGDLYINDGIYGCLAEIQLGQLKPPVRAFGRGRELGSALKTYRLFGPTCDSLDVFRVQFELPEDIGEGDWIEFRRMGAYSIGMQTAFNGFFIDTVVEIGEADGES